MKTTLLSSVFLSSLLLMVSCGKEQNNKVEGYKPIYTDAKNLETVEVTSSEALENPGRIYLYENYLLINDQAKGIHIYNNSNPSSPTQVSFISIPGNMDFSVRQGILYADNITDMVIVDISNPAAPVYRNRIKDVFPVQQFPDEFGDFECVDPAKGVVVGWEKAMLDDPKCSR
ncbi:MAG: hypothetical protein MI810_18795 [Flavobacteriales bacterium]|jgi:hypothetical protein|nr:hypothetical protein [Flavobacteriales bacterium]